MKKLFIGLILSPLVMFSAAPPPPATQAEVDAGLDSYKYVTPKTLGLTTLIGTNAGISRAVATNVVTDNALLLTQTNGFAAGLTNLAKTYSDATTNATGIRAITAQQTNYATLISMLGPLTNGLGGASSGLLEVDSNGRLATTNLVDRYETNTLTIGQGPPANLNSAIHFVGGATPHIETFGPSSWWDFNTPVTNADVVHFSSVVVMDPDNVVFGAGTLALATATATTPAENDNDTSVATTAYVQTEIAGFGSGQTNVTDTAAYGSTVNSNLLVKGTFTVYGASAFQDLTATNFVIATNWDASLATNLNGTEIRSGTVADARIASTITRDTEWDTLGEIEAIILRTITTNNATLTATTLMVGDGARGVSPTTTGAGVLTTLGIGTNTAGGIVTQNGPLGTPSSGSGANLTALSAANITAGGAITAVNMAAATNYAQTNLVSYPLTFASATNTLNLNNGYSTLAIGTDFAITNLSGIISGQQRWGTLVVSNSAASAITGRMTVGATVRAQGNATTNALVIGAAKVGYITFDSLVGTNYWNTAQQ